MSSRLELDSLIFNRGEQKILRNVSLSLETGTVLSVKGLNGSGKSSLLDIIAGIIRPQQCFLRIDGRVYTGLERKYLDVAYLPQYDFMPGYLSVGRICKDYGITAENLEGYFPQFDNIFGVKIKSLSGGERRILSILAVLSLRAKFVLLDEPFTHIMPLHIESVCKLIMEAKSCSGIILTDHISSYVDSVSDETLYLHEGVLSRN